MATDILRRLGALVALCLVQALVLNSIHLFDCATPLLYVYLVLVFPLGYPRWGVMLWAFAMGLAVDIFSNTPGMAAASLTLVGAVQPHFFSLFVQREASADVRPSFKVLGPWKMTFYVFALTFLHCLAFFTIEFFSLFHWQRLVACTLGSAVVTTALILTLEGVRTK